MQIKLFLNSATELKNVNSRCGSPQPYAIAWIDTSAKCSTKVDVNNGDNPVWNEKFTIQLPPISHPESAILYIQIVNAKHAEKTNPLVGSAKLAIRMALDGVRSQGKAPFSLVLERPSGRFQGILHIQIEMKDTNIIQNTPYGQPARNMPPQPQPLYRPQQTNPYRNTPVSIRPGYPINASLGLGNALALAIGAHAAHRTRLNMLALAGHRIPAAFNRFQGANAGMVNNNGFLGNATSSNDPSGAQWYPDGSDMGGFDMGGFGTGGFDMGGFGTGGFDMGGFGTGGFDMGGFGTGGFDMGGLGMGGFDMGGFGMGGFGM